MRGECTIQHLYREDGTVRGVNVTHADPQILITRELLESVARASLDGTCAPWVMFHRLCRCIDSVHSHDLAGSRLVILGANRRVVYRIGRLDKNLDCYTAEWPD